MHEGHENAKRARDILKACGINVGADFGALDASQVDALHAHLPSSSLEPEVLSRKAPRKHAKDCPAATPKLI